MEVRQKTADGTQGYSGCQRVMIRFRVGHRWREEELGPGGPRDEFGLELEGINLLPGANDEPLLRIVTSLIDTLSALVVDGERVGQLSLEDVHLEVCFWRTQGLDVELSVVDLSTPPRQTRAPLTIELQALVDAGVKCARNFLRDVAQHRDTLESELVSLEKKVKRLTSVVLQPRAAKDVAPWSAVRAADTGPGFSLRDDEGRTLSWSRKTRAGLPPLLFAGELTLADGVVKSGHPFLQMMGLARLATEGKAVLEGHAIAPERVFVAGLDLCLALRARNPSLAANPYVEALQVRCTDGLTALRQPIPDTSVAKVSAPRATPGVPLAPVGELRRVGLQPRWTRPAALGEEGGEILLSRDGAIVHSPHAVHAFGKKGETLFRHLSARGVAVAASGTVLCGAPDRLTCYAGSEPVWFRDHDGMRPGPNLEEIDGVLVCTLGRRTAAGYAALTGREVWRFEPPRTQTMTFSRVGSRVLLGTDGGTLYGIDAHDGQVRFRVKAGLPVVRPAVQVGKRALVVLNRGEHSAIYLCDALSSGATTPAGAITWTRELILSMPGTPVASRGKFWVSGSREGRTLVLCLGSKGQVLWEKPIACDTRTTRLLAYEGGVIASDARGAAVRLLPDGATEWVLGSSGDELHQPLAPLVRRKALIVPGPVTRIVQPHGGRVLGELATGARMLDLAVDARMNISVLREPGSLETYAPGTALAVVKNR